MNLQHLITHLWRNSKAMYGDTLLKQEPKASLLKPCWGLTKEQSFCSQRSLYWGAYMLPNSVRRGSWETNELWGYAAQLMGSVEMVTPCELQWHYMRVSTDFAISWKAVCCYWFYCRGSCCTVWNSWAPSPQAVAEQCMGENRTKIILEYRSGRVVCVKVPSEMKLSVWTTSGQRCENVSLRHCKEWVPTKE